MVFLLVPNLLVPLLATIKKPAGSSEPAGCCASWVTPSLSHHPHSRYSRHAHSHARRTGKRTDDAVQERSHESLAWHSSQLTLSVTSSTKKSLGSDTSVVPPKYT